MKRDMDRVREILREVEGQPWDKGLFELKIHGYDRRKVQYHLAILEDAGLNKAVNTASSERSEAPLPQRLTWQGHEFLEAARDDTGWGRAKSHVREQVGGIPFDVLLMVLKQPAREAVFGDGSGS